MQMAKSSDRLLVPESKYKRSCWQAPLTAFSIAVSWCLKADSRRPSRMPKVSKKDVKDQAALQPVPMVMDADDDNQPSTSGAQPTLKFPPMSVFDQNGRKIEFRRVCADSCTTCFPLTDEAVGLVVNFTKLSTGISLESFQKLPYYSCAEF